MATPLLTLAIDGMSGQIHALAALSPANESPVRYPLVKSEIIH
jgi:hypothetical protein